VRGACCLSSAGNRRSKRNVGGTLTVIAQNKSYVDAVRLVSRGWPTWFRMRVLFATEGHLPIEIIEIKGARERNSRRLAVILHKTMWVQFSNKKAQTMLPRTHRTHEKRSRLIAHPELAIISKQRHVCCANGFEIASIDQLTDEKFGHFFTLTLQSTATDRSLID